MTPRNRIEARSFLPTAPSHQRCRGRKCRCRGLEAPVLLRIDGNGGMGGRRWGCDLQQGIPHYTWLPRSPSKCAVPAVTRGGGQQQHRGKRGPTGQSLAAPSANLGARSTLTPPSSANTPWVATAATAATAARRRARRRRGGAWGGNVYSASFFFRRNKCTFSDGSVTANERARGTGAFGGDAGRKGVSRGGNVARRRAPSTL